MAINESKLNEFMMRFVGDLGAVAHAPLVIVGEKLGLYKAMAGAGGVTAGDLAKKAGTDTRYTEEWLAANAASGYIEYDATTRRYTLPEEQALALAVEDSPVYIPGAFQLALSLFRDIELTEAALKTGRGVGWHEHDRALFAGTERFFRPGYTANLCSSWIPALEGVKAKLEAGARVADVGCGHGASTVIMAKAYPKSKFFGFDYHDASVTEARRAAERAGVSDRVTFQIAAAKDLPLDQYDFVTYFDCLHDMGDPVGAARRVRDALAPGGTFMIVEPRAGDRVEDNLNPVGRIFYSASTQLCTPASRSQEVGLALGAQAGEARLREVLLAAGFGTVRRAAETPFNMILEARL